MAAAILRRYSAALTTTAPITIVSAVPTARVLVIGKILVAAGGASTITLTVGGANIATNFALSAGQVYSETGLVLLATETITATAGTASQLVVSVYGEETDN